MRTTFPELVALVAAISLFSTGPALTLSYPSSASTSGVHLFLCSLHLALCMWLVHASKSFLAIICCAASISFVAIVFASPSSMA